jgi:S-adenosylmethionine/arginine decarboxylase-like enzyme
MAKFVPEHFHLILSQRLVGEPGVGALLATDQITKDDIEISGKGMLLDLVAALGMKAVTQPQCVYVDAEGNEGPTGSINLATSHIAFHYWTVDKRLEMDIYSCKPYADRLPEVFGIIERYFGKLDGSAAWLDRNEFGIIPLNAVPNEEQTVTLDELLGYEDYVLGV